MTTRQTSLLMDEALELHVLALQDIVRRTLALLQAGHDGSTPLSDHDVSRALTSLRQAADEIAYCVGEGNGTG